MDRFYINGKPPAFYSSEHLNLMSKPELIKIYIELQVAAIKYERLLMKKKENQKQVEDIDMLEAFSL